MQKTLLLGVTLVLGALLGVVGVGLRSAHADEEGARSAYFCFQASDVMDLQTKSNVAAKNGWQMVTAGMTGGGTAWCFKQTR